MQNFIAICQAVRRLFQKNSWRASPPLYGRGLKHAFAFDDIHKNRRNKNFHCNFLLFPATRGRLCGNFTRWNSHATMFVRPWQPYILKRWRFSRRPFSPAEGLPYPQRGHAPPFAYSRSDESMYVNESIYINDKENDEKKTTPPSTGLRLQLRCMLKIRPCLLYSPKKFILNILSPHNT